MNLSSSQFSTRWLIFAALCALAVQTASGLSRHAYTNDFSTRTSGATPPGRWMEADYIPGALTRPVSSVDANSPYNTATGYQDAWTAKANYCRTTVPFTVADYGGNLAVLANPTTPSYVTNATVAMTPLYNEFTDGLVKISVDVRTPAASAFNASADAYAFLVPLYKSALDVTGTALSTGTRIGMGNVSDGSTRNARAVAFGSNEAGTGTTYFGRQTSETAFAVEAGNWYRYEAVIDVAAGTFTASVGNLGAAHPTSASSPFSTLNFSRWAGGQQTTTLPLRVTQSDATGGIGGLALYVQGFRQSAAAADAPMFDNIAVSWKAPGAADFVSAYENDFSTRRYRQIEPAGTTSGAYVPVPTTNIVQSSFYERANVNNDYGVGEDSARRLVPDSAPYAGQDGWRRIAGGAPFTMVDPNKDSGGYGWTNASVLRATGSGKTGMVAAPLGTTVTSGKVRLYCDILMGALTNSTSQTRDIGAAAFLAGDCAFTNACYDTTRLRVADIASALRGKGVCGAGTCYSDRAAGAYQTNSRLYRFNGSGYAAQKSASNENIFINCGRWGRYVVTLDLDAGKYDYAVYDLGHVGQPMDYEHSSATVLVATNNLSLAESAIRNVDSVVLFSEGQDNYNGKTTTYNGKALGRFPLFDNVRVCLVNGDGTDGADLYACNFEYGSRMSVQNATPLAGPANREGADRWIRRGNTFGTISVLDAGSGDGVAVLDGLGWIGSVTRAGYAVQPFGAFAANCASVDFAADIRPPACFARDSGCFALVEAGGDAYAQGVYRPASGSSWRSEPRIGFGFSAGAGYNAVKQYTNVVLTVQSVASPGASATSTTSAAVIDTSHWYRFRVKAKPTGAGGTFTVKVHDQGTSKPAAADADGALVATFSDLALPNFGEPGMTTLGLAGAGFHSFYGGGLDDPNVALIDNLSATFDPAENAPAKRLDYIAANTQGLGDYVNLGVIAKSGTKMVVEMDWPSISGTPVLCGAATNASTARFWMLGRNGNINLAGYAATTPYISSSSYPITKGEKYRLTSVIDAGSLSLSCKRWDEDAGAWKSWGSVSKTDIGSMDTGLPLYLFADNVNGTAEAFAMARVYSLKLWQRDEAGEWRLVRYLLPARMASGETAFYDRVTRGWFRNAAAGRAFSAGASSDWSDGVSIRYK